MRRLYSYIVISEPATRVDTVRLDHSGEAAILSAFEYDRKHATNDAQTRLLSDFERDVGGLYEFGANVMALAEPGDPSGALAELASGNIDQPACPEDQAASLEQTAASMS
ncbi:hypothetical protein [Paraburkholderia sp.]|uniref:hypothetical protein n=1 Tax=Paraburkholderia sp. TaxID=1926495 RepID=UPI002F3EDF56